MSSTVRPPLPPPELVHYVGHRDPEEQMAEYDLFGRRFRDDILALLPDDWSFAGKRVLDFGCASGRVLRHFLAEAEEADVHGCDIDRASIEWLRENLSPPLQLHHTAEEPPLPFPDGHFDLVWATSVFSTLSDGWSAWLLELHRVLRDDGLLISTILGEEASQPVAGEPWDEDRVGMNVLRYGESWEAGGPVVFHSPWWIREHWGRAFDVLELRSRISNAEGIVLLRRRPVEVTVEDLERIDPGEARELTALRHNLRQQQRELQALRDSHNAYATAYQQERSRLAVVERERDDLRRERDALRSGEGRPGLSAGLGVLARRGRAGLAALRRRPR